MEPGGRAEEKFVRNGVQGALALAKDNQIESVAFPALGTGVGGLDLESCARVMLPVISKWLKENSHPQVVEIVLFDESAQKIFLDVWNRLKLEGEL